MWSDERHTQTLGDNTTVNASVGYMEDKMTTTQSLPTLTLFEWGKKYITDLPPSQFRKQDLVYGTKPRVLWKDENEAEAQRNALVLEGLRYMTEAGLAECLTDNNGETPIADHYRLNAIQQLMEKWQERLERGLSWCLNCDTHSREFNEDGSNEDCLYVCPNCGETYDGDELSEEAQ